MTDDRPPAYVSRKTLAHELDCAESTVDELVKRGVLPKPLHLSNGCVRWCWGDVVLALASLGKAPACGIDPYLSGVKNVASELQARGR